MTLASDRDRIIDVIEGHRRFFVTAHRNPEADALGSSLALAHFLRELGKEATAVTVDPVPRVLDFLPHRGIHQRIERLDTPPEVLFVLDCGDAERTGLITGGAGVNRGAHRGGAATTSVSPDIAEGPRSDNMIIANIDHHITNRQFGQVNWVDPNAAATAELIYDLIQTLRRPITPPVALCLYTALASETGFFAYSNTSPRVFRIAADLVEGGVDPWRVAQRLRENTPERLRLMGEVLAGMARSEDGRIAWVSVTQAMFARTGTTAEDTEDFVNLPRSLPGVEVAVLFREVDAATCKVSFRARHEVDVAAIASGFSGGGHKKAAGCTVKGDLAAAQRVVLAAVAAAVAAAPTGNG